MGRQGLEGNRWMVPGPKWSQNSGPLAYQDTALSAVTPLPLLERKWLMADVFPKNVEMALLGSALWGHACRCCRLWGRGSSSLHGEETGRATVPRDAPEAQKEAPGRLGPWVSAQPWPPNSQLPPNTTSMHHGDPSPQGGADRASNLSTGRRAQGTLTAGVLGTAVRLFKVVLCFALYSPTESAFCWWGQERARENDGD